MRNILLSLGISVLVLTSSRAVVVYDDVASSSTYTTSSESIWDYVGTVNGASGVYLGEYNGTYWVVTAAHVGAGNIVLNGVSYSYVADSAIRITNGDGSAADLVVYQISSAPALSSLTISSSTPTDGASVTMIGYGRSIISSGLQYWQVTDSGAGYTWTSSPGPGGANAQGYWVGAPKVKRWGNNTIEGTSLTSGGVTVTTYNTGWGDTYFFYTDFDAVTGEGQGSEGDSGGGVFYYNSATGTWELAGIMGAVGTFQNQPSDTGTATVVVGNVTYVVDLSVYRDAIFEAISNSVIPEPAGVAAIAGLAVLWTAARRRRETV